MTRESSDAPEPSSSEIPPGLAFESSVPQRIEALQRLLSVAAVASAIGVTPEALRQWKTQAASIRPSNSNALDDLRCAAATLFEAGYDDQSVSNWLTSRHARARSGRSS